MGIRMNRSTTPEKQVEQGGANTPLHHCSTTPPPKGGEGGGGAAGGAPEVVEQSDPLEPFLAAPSKIAKANIIMRLESRERHAIEVRADRHMQPFPILNSLNETRFRVESTIWKGQKNE